MIRWLLDNFGDADSVAKATSTAGIHPLVFLYQYFVLEFFIELACFGVLKILLYLFDYHKDLIAITVVIGVMFITMLFGVYILYTHNAYLLRWYSLRIKLIYLTLGIWGFAGLFYLDDDLIDRAISVAMISVAVLFSFEDKALVQVLYFEKYRYVGI